MNKSLSFSIRPSRWLIPVMTLILALSAAQLQAQQNKSFSRMRIDSRETSEYLKTQIADKLAKRNEPLKVLSTADYLIDCQQEQLWTNGICIYRTDYDDGAREIYFAPIMQSDNFDDIIPVPPLVLKGRDIVVSNKPDVKVTVEQVGGNILLVGRNAQGAPVMVLHHVTLQQLNDGNWALLALYPVMGNYSLPTGRNAVFGPKQDFYSGEKYDTDPGSPDAIYIRRDFKSIDILYGNGRVSNGNPDAPGWGKQPGGGGARAIMGPMEWSLTPTIEGLRVVLVHDEPFVNHEPSIGREGDIVKLTKVQGPFPGLDGKWAFASVIPMTESLLKLFPKEVLTLMRGEIYARHGDTFKDPATQRYFSSQPWYKKSGNPIRLTDVERFNYQLIKQVESTMK